MIKVDISTAFFLYLLFTAVFILIIWSFFNFGTKLKTFSSEEKHVWHCSVCAFTYIDSRNEEISNCPRCGSYNQKVPSHSLNQDISSHKDSEEMGKVKREVSNDNKDRSRSRRNMEPSGKE